MSSSGGPSGVAPVEVVQPEPLGEVRVRRRARHPGSLARSDPGAEAQPRLSTAHAVTATRLCLAERPREAPAEPLRTPAELSGVAPKISCRSGRRRRCQRHSLHDWMGCCLGRRGAKSRAQTLCRPRFAVTGNHQMPEANLRWDHRPVEARAVTTWLDRLRGCDFRIAMCSAGQRQALVGRLLGGCETPNPQDARSVCRRAPDVVDLVMSFRVDDRAGSGAEGARPGSR